MGGAPCCVASELGTGARRIDVLLGDGLSVPGKRLAVSLTRGAPSAQHRKAFSALRATSRTTEVLPKPWHALQISELALILRIRLLPILRLHMILCFVVVFL